MPKFVKRLALSELAPRVDVAPYLEFDERVVSQFGPYFATSQRVLLVTVPRTESEFHEIPYSQLESIDELKVFNHQRLSRGAVLASAGILISLIWLSIVSIALVIFGILWLLRGALWKDAYYQLRGRGMEGPELYRWQLKHDGAGSFIASIQTITGRIRRE